MGDVKQKIKIGKINFKSDVEQEIKNLILRMLQVDPKKRPSVAQILEIPFIKNFNQSIDDQFFTNPIKKVSNKNTKDRLTKKKLNRNIVKKYNANFSQNMNETSYTMSSCNYTFFIFF